MVNLFSPDVSFTEGLSVSTSNVDNKSPLENITETYDVPLTPSHKPTLTLEDPFGDTEKKAPDKASTNEKTVLKTGNSPSEIRDAFSATEVNKPDHHDSAVGLINVFDHPVDTVRDRYGSPAGTEKKEKKPASSTQFKTAEVSEITTEPDDICPVQPTVPAIAPVLPSSKDELSQLRKENQRLKKLLQARNYTNRKTIEQSMEIALEQTLLELSPDYLETLFDDYSHRKTGLFRRRRDNWQLYRSHFFRIMRERKLSLVFLANLKECSKNQQKDTSC